MTQFLVLLKGAKVPMRIENNFGTFGDLQKALNSRDFAHTRTGPNEILFSPDAVAAVMAYSIENEKYLAYVAGGVPNMLDKDKLDAINRKRLNARRRPLSMKEAEAVIASKPPISDDTGLYAVLTAVALSSVVASSPADTSDFSGGGGNSGGGGSSGDF